MKKIRYTLLFISLIISFTVHSQRIDIGPPVNEPNAIESTPSISLDGKTLIYVSDKTGIQQYYQCTLKPDGLWDNPVPIDSINKLCKPASLLGASSLSFDGNTLYFCAIFETGFGDMDIYVSKRKGKVWGAPINLGNVINSETYEGTPSISVNEKVLYFAKDNPGYKTKGFQCKKIYVSEKDSAGNWRTPVPLPVPVNLDCEQSPRICFDDRTLFFSSVREGSVGKADMYMTKILAKNIYSAAIPMAFTNTEQGDMYASVLASGDRLYYSISSNESASGAFGGVFLIDIPIEFRPFHSLTIFGNVKDSITGDPLRADIIVKNANTTIEEFRISSNEVDGNYTLVLAEGKNYSIEFSTENYSSKFLSYDLRKLEKNRQERLNIGLFASINLELNIYDSELYEPLTADIQIIDSQTGKKSNIATDIDRMPSGRYKIQVSKQNYSSASFDFDLSSTIQFDRFVKNIELTAVREDYIFDISKLGIQDGETVELISKNMYNSEKIVIKITRRGDEYIIEEPGKEPYTVKDKFTARYVKGGKYDVSVSPKGYFFYNTIIDLEDSASGMTSIQLEPIITDTKFTLENIVFETNSAELNSSSFGELDKLVNMLSKNNSVKIEISAHTDDIGSNNYNLQLSNKRAKSVVSYLIEKNINATRLIFVGYGESKPAIPNNSEANRAINRRVELRITGTE